MRLTESGAPAIFHIALPADWERAGALGRYLTSTRGRSLEEEGFIHCSYRHQVVDIANHFYADLEEVILLTIDPTLLDAAVIAESPPAGGEAYPHVYGPLALPAVVAATPWHRQGPGYSLDI